MRRLTHWRPQARWITAIRLPSIPRPEIMERHQALESVGLILIIAGVALMHIPSALIVGGLGLILGGLIDSPATMTPQEEDEE